MKNIFYLSILFFVANIPFASGFSTNKFSKNSIFYNIKNADNQIDTSIIDIENFEVKEELRSIKMLAKTAIGLSVGGLVTFGLSLIPALVIGVIAFSKYQKYKDIYDEMKPDDANYAFLKKLNRLVLTALLVPFTPIALLLLFLGGIGDFEPGERVMAFSFLAALVFVVIECFGLKTNKIIDK